MYEYGWNVRPFFIAVFQSRTWWSALVRKFLVGSLWFRCTLTIDALVDGQPPTAGPRKPSAISFVIFMNGRSRTSRSKHLDRDAVHFF